MPTPIYTDSFGEVLQVAELRSVSCTGCVGKHNECAKSDLPMACSDERVIFIKNTPEAIAEYVKLRMSK